jgi:uncharacterized protein
VTSSAAPDGAALSYPPGDTMHGKLLSETIHYDGSQLRSGWVGEVTGLHGDALVAFRGSCDVSPEHMLDTEDLEQGHAIRAKLMLHLIVEHLGIGLDLAVARQRLLACLAREALEGRYEVPGVERVGDDLHVRRRKLSISVAAVSPTSGLIHFAVNVDPEGAPVPAIGLTELGIEPTGFAEGLLEAYVAEIASCRHAAAKVRGAK